MHETSFVVVVVVVVDEKAYMIQVKVQPSSEKKWISWTEIEHVLVMTNLTVGAETKRKVQKPKAIDVINVTYNATNWLIKSASI